jgi:hypothetical protein
VELHLVLMRGIGAGLRHDNDAACVQHDIGLPVELHLVLMRGDLSPRDPKDYYLKTKGPPKGGPFFNLKQRLIRP